MVLGQERIWVSGIPSIFYDAKTMRKRKSWSHCLCRWHSDSSRGMFHSHHLEENMKRKIGIITYILCSGTIIHEVYSVCVCVLSCFSRVRFCATPWTVGSPAPLSMGFSRQDSSPGNCPDPGIEPASLIFLHWQADSLSLAPPGKPLNIWIIAINYKRMLILIIQKEDLSLL